MATVGTTTYKLTPAELREVKAAARLVNLPWRPMAARPEEARELIAHYRATMARCAEINARAEGR